MATCSRILSTRDAGKENLPVRLSIIVPRYLTLVAGASLHLSTFKVTPTAVNS